MPPLHLPSFITRLLGAGLFAFVSFLSANALEWKLQPVDFDGTAIMLATPADYALASVDNPRIVFTKKALPPTNLLVAGFISPTNNSQYCLVQQVVQTKT